jgi:hypothetical protein
MRLDTRLLDYIDEMAPPVTTEEAIARLRKPNPSRRGLAWALVAFAAVLTVAGLVFALGGSDGPVVDQTTVPTPTTVPAPSPEPPVVSGMWPRYSILDGEVTFAAAPSWAKRDWLESSDTYLRFRWFATVGDEWGEEHVVIGTDPLPACENSSAPADAEALARMIMADPNSETTGTVPVRIASLYGLQMDVDVADYSCWRNWGPDQLEQWRTRLYLIDYPGPSTQILVIAVIAEEEVFERALKEATPIVESLEIHAD